MQYDRNAPKVPDPRPVCTVCLTSEGVMLHSESAGLARPLCPKCAAREAVREAAEWHLHSLLWPAVVRWVHHWHAAGVAIGQMQATLWVYGTHWHPHGQFARPGEEKQAVLDALSEAPEFPDEA